jgi:hypothetical protein
MRPFKITKCKDKAVYSAKLLDKKELNLSAIARTFDVIEDTPILLLIVVDNEEVIVHRHGELMFKSCKNKEKMTNIADKIYAVGLLSA